MGSAGESVTFQVPESKEAPAGSRAEPRRRGAPTGSDLGAAPAVTEKAASETVNVPRERGPGQAKEREYSNAPESSLEMAASSALNSRSGKGRPVWEIPSRSFLIEKVRPSAAVRLRENAGR